MGCCQALTGIVRECDSNIGGIRRAWIACHDGAPIPVTDGGIITALASDDEKAKLSEYKLYEFRKQTGSVSTTITRDDAAGSLYYETSIIFQFSKQETSKRIEINAIALSDTVVIVEDNNKKYWFFGYDFPVTLSDGTAETGTALSDMNGYNITLNDLSKELPYEIEETAMVALLALES